MPICYVLYYKGGVKTKIVQFSVSSCDRQFLAFAHRNITVPPLIAALKVMLLLGDAEDSTRGMTKIFNVDDDDDDDFGLSMKSSSKGRQSNEKLSDFAKHTLKQICSQEWVHNRCLQVR